jgi:pyruvate formate lyase activating enzyme
MEMSGKLYSAEELLKIIERERVHIDQSGGGVTFSGGEPLMFPEFLIEMLDACGEKGLHRAVDTCGFVPAKTLLEVARRTDLFLFDLKLMDPVQHKKWTGVDNQLILKNLRLLAETGANINIRIPFIKNVNTNENEVRRMAEFVSAMPGKKPVVNLLPYHNIATGKYKKLEMEYNSEGMEEPTATELKMAIEIFNRNGLEAETGG